MVSAAPPPFRQIAQVLRDGIVDGLLAPDERLPSENELAERFGTTRATVRKAIALLRAEGLVFSEQGRGAFVRSRPHLSTLPTGANYRARRATGVSNITAEAAAQGKRLVQRLLAVEETLAPAQIAERLNIAANARVIVRRRLFVIDGEPMQTCDGYYDAELFRDTPVARNRRIKGGVHSVLEDSAAPRKLRLAQFVEDLEIRLPTPAEKKLLAIPPRVPVVRLLRTAYDSHGHAVEVLDSLVPVDRYTFKYVIDVP